MPPALRHFLERFGDLVSRWLLSAIYLVLVAPIGLCFRFFGDPLGIRAWRGTSFVPWKKGNTTLREARRQVS
ncbi:MAG: hypothetical protein IPN34_24460 [Planctomycetes bacterium]|nr:hypothetical protein [Planctomycetota bacterium]